MTAALRSKCSGGEGPVVFLMLVFGVIGLIVMMKGCS